MKERKIKKGVLNSINKNSSKLNYFFKSALSNSSFIPKKERIKIPELQNYSPEISDFPVENQPKVSPVKNINKEDYSHSLFKNTLNDIKTKVNSLLLKKETVPNKPIYINKEVNKTIKSINTDKIRQNTPILEKTENKEVKPSVFKKNTEVNNFVVKPTIKTTEKLVPSHSKIQNIAKNTKKVFINQPKEIIKSHDTKLVPQKEIIKSHDTKLVPQVIHKNTYNKNEPKKEQNSNINNRNVSNTFNKLENINKVNLSQPKFSKVIKGTKENIKNALDNSLTLHTVTKNSENILNTTKSMTNKIQNTMNPDLSALSDKISTILNNKPKIIPSLAEGGYATEPTVAKIGDSKTASGKKEGELVIQPSKLPEILAETQIIEQTNKLVQKNDIQKNQQGTLPDIANNNMVKNVGMKLNQTAQNNQAATPQLPPPVIINQGSTKTVTNPGVDSTGDKLTFNDAMNNRVPRWRSGIG